MTILTYKGYHAQIEVEPEAKVLSGRILDLRDVIVFEGDTVMDVEEQFHLSVDDYLAQCVTANRAPEKPFSGKLVLRMTPEMHRAAVIAAARQHKSLNIWLTDAVDAAARAEE